MENIEKKHIDDEMLSKAYEKLSCKIELPGEEASSCGPSSCDVSPAAERVRLTEMTTAGG